MPQREFDNDDCVLQYKGNMVFSRRIVATLVLMFMLYVEKWRRDMNKNDFFAVMHGLGAMTYHKEWPCSGKQYFSSEPKEPKQCLECGKDHQHNNSWCSKECCKNWRLKNK
jgi:hypothetical protein